MLFPQHIGAQVSIGEAAVPHGGLRTAFTNKAKHGKRGALIAMIRGTKAADLAKVFMKMTPQQRAAVAEAAMDMAEHMEAAVRRSFPQAKKIVTDRFHAQQLVSDAVQDMRIEMRREALKEEHAAIKKARAERAQYVPFVYENGGTKKQLLARRRSLLFKPQSEWNGQQQERAAILFKAYPQLKTA